MISYWWLVISRYVRRNWWVRSWRFWNRFLLVIFYFFIMKFRCYNRSIQVGHWISTNWINLGSHFRLNLRRAKSIYLNRVFIGFFGGLRLRVLTLNFFYCKALDSWFLRLLILWGFIMISKWSSLQNVLIRQNRTFIKPQLNINIIIINRFNNRLRLHPGVMSLDRRWNSTELILSWLWFDHTVEFVRITLRWMFFETPQ